MYTMIGLLNWKALPFLKVLLCYIFCRRNFNYSPFSTKMAQAVGGVAVILSYRGCYRYHVLIVIMFCPACRNSS